MVKLLLQWPMLKKHKQMISESFLFIPLIVFYLSLITFPPSFSLISWLFHFLPSPCSFLLFLLSPLASIIFFDCLHTCFFLSNSLTLPPRLLLHFPVIFSSLSVSFLLDHHHLSLVSITARACKCRGSTNVALQHACVWRHI